MQALIQSCHKAIAQTGCLLPDMDFLQRINDYKIVHCIALKCDFLVTTWNKRSKLSIMARGNNFDRDGQSHAG
jgi:hypothetical protein